MEECNSEDIGPSLGTAHYKLECYIKAILTALRKHNHSCYFDLESLYLMGEDEIKALCKTMGIGVEIYG